MLIGLTGTFSSGKSLVAEMLHEYGAALIDADAIAHKVVEPGSSALDDIRREFGSEYILADGVLDRKRMAETVFSSRERREALNAIVHPLVREEIWRQVESIEATATPPALIVLNIPLLFEGGLDRKVSRVIVVTINESERYRRARQRDGLSEAQVTRRLASQWPQRLKIQRADALIDNSGTPEATRGQVRQIYNQLIQAASEDSTPAPSGSEKSQNTNSERLYSQ